MATLTKEDVIFELEKHLNLTLRQLPTKRIIYSGKILDVQESVVVCTPESKLHERGNGWIDLTTVQVNILNESKLAILAIRLPDERVVYLDFKKVKPLLTDGTMVNNNREGDHWKLHIWPDRITVLGHQNELPLNGQTIEQLAEGFRKR